MHNTVLQVNGAQVNFRARGSFFWIAKELVDTRTLVLFPQTAMGKEKSTAIHRDSVLIRLNSFIDRDGMGKSSGWREFLRPFAVMAKQDLPTLEMEKSSDGIFRQIGHAEIHLGEGTYYVWLFCNGPSYLRFSKFSFFFSLQIVLQCRARNIIEFLFIFK